MPIGLKLFPDSVRSRVVSLSVDVLPDIQHPAHGPPSSTKPNPFHSACHQTSHLLGIHILWFVVRFSSRRLIPRITLSHSYLTHDYLQNWPYVHMGSAHVSTRYLYIYMCVRMKPLIQKGAAWNLFLLIHCLLYSRHRIFYRIWLTARRPPGMVLLAQG